MTGGLKHNQAISHCTYILWEFVLFGNTHWNSCTFPW